MSTNLTQIYIVQPLSSHKPTTISTHTDHKSRNLTVPSTTHKWHSPQNLGTSNPPSKFNCHIQSIRGEANLPQREKQKQRI